MTSDIDTVKLLMHIDAKFDESDRKRAVVHDKIDEHIRETQSSLGAFRHETSAALGALSNQVGQHDLRLQTIESQHEFEQTRVDGWAKAIATIVLGGGGLAALVEWLRGRA